jgi:DMSO/TMAO reductase YedYZ heme-binding membrane subunit
VKKCPKCGFFLDDAAEKCTNCDYIFSEKIQFVKEQKVTRTIRRFNRSLSIIGFILMLPTIALPWGAVLTVSISMWDILSSAIPKGPGIIWKFITQGGNSALSQAEQPLMTAFIGSIFFIVAILGALAGALTGVNEKLPEKSWFLAPGIFGILCVVLMFLYFGQLPLSSLGIGFVIFLIASLILTINGLVGKLAE